MITSINSLALKKEMKTPNKRNNHLNYQDILVNNDKNLVTHETYTLSTEKKASRIKDFNINQIKHFNILGKIYKNSYDIKNIKKYNNAQIKNYKNIYNLININKINNKKKNSSNIQDITKILNNDNFSSIINTENNNNEKLDIFKIHKSPKSIIKLPSIQKKILLTEADNLVNHRTKQEGMVVPHFANNIILKKSADINLKNYVIRKIKEKREEIQNDEKKLAEDFRNKKIIYEKRRRNFLDSIEQSQNKQKEEEIELNKLRLEIENLENILNKENIENKKLLNELKQMINLIKSFTKYGSFVNKVFRKQFIYDDLKEYDSRDYYKMMIKYIDIYDKYTEDNNFQKERDEFIAMLQIEGVDSLLMKFSDLEDNIRNLLDNNNIIYDEIKNLNDKNNIIINSIINKKKENEKEKMIFNKDKNKKILSIKDLKKFDISELETYFKYIIEFWEILCPSSNGKHRQNLEINGNTLIYCNETLKALEEKEDFINKCINEIDDIIKKGEDKDKVLIQNIIIDRKKSNLREKQIEIKDIQEKINNKNSYKTLAEQKIFIKGRKVIQDFPLITNNKRKKKSTLNNINDRYDYLYYSSDENEDKNDII